MNPKNRKLMKLVISDDVSADKMFGRLMGKSAEPRKKYLAEHVNFEFSGD